MHYFSMTFFSDRLLGEYPLYDVSVRMWDPNDYNNVPQNVDFEELIKKDRNFNLGNVSPHQARTLGRITLPGSDNKDFALSIAARNGFVTELIKLRKVDGKWKAAYKVTKDEGKGEPKVLFEQIESRFPLNENGQVQW